MSSTLRYVALVVIVYMCVVVVVVLLFGIIIVMYVWSLHYLEIHMMVRVVDMNECLMFIIILMPCVCACMCVCVQQ